MYSTSLLPLCLRGMLHGDLYISNINKQGKYMTPYAKRKPRQISEGSTLRRHPPQNPILKHPRFRKGNMLQWSIFQFAFLTLGMLQ